LSLPASKEAAFASAIRAAGVAYRVTQACSQGAVLSCGCSSSSSSSKPNPSSSSSSWQWGGCGADIQYGLAFSRLFLDAKEIREDERALMNRHNNRAGRKVSGKL
jgi:wingless-type MMTV integration site family protein 7